MKYIFEGRPSRNKFFRWRWWWYFGWNKLFLKIPQNWIDDGGGLQKEDIILTFPPFQVFSKFKLIMTCHDKKGQRCSSWGVPPLGLCHVPLGGTMLEDPNQEFEEQEKLYLKYSFAFHFRTLSCEIRVGKNVASVLNSGYFTTRVRVEI